MKISIYAPYAKERFETARQHSILHPERIVGNPYLGITLGLRIIKGRPFEVGFECQPELYRKEHPL
jgi:hypothetical protein